MKTNIKTLICTAATALAVGSAYAVPLNTDAIRYSTDGINWKPVVLDNQSGDLDPGDNTITLIIAGLPGLVLHVTSAGNALGTAGSPNIDIGLHGSIGAGETLYVEYSDVNYGPVPSGGYHTHISTTDDPTVSATQYTAIGSGAGANDLFDGAGFSDLPSLSKIGPITGNGAGDSFTAPGTSDPYSITLVTVVTGGANGGGVSTDARVTSVPDGGNTLMLLGSALSVLGFGAFRKSRKA
jgi:hypothetical protein